MSILELKGLKERNPRKEENSMSPRKANRRKPGTRKQGPIFNAAKKLSVFTIKEEEVENPKPLKAIMKILKSETLQRVYYLKCGKKKTGEKKVFEYLPIAYKKTMSEEMVVKWRKKYEEDKHELYSDQQVTTKDTSSPVRVTARSDATMTVCEATTITEDQRISGWDQISGILDFEPENARGNVSKAIQIRGSLPDI
uniref:Uncharacterized protein n=1 Tax=Setaria digitata TaxID=48799 RepID=A0A915Q315_9BILA